ncbi:hypothetical protein CHUAL_008438 [Chamberlinius hualienensis]
MGCTRLVTILTVMTICLHLTAAGGSSKTADTSEASSNKYSTDDEPYQISLKSSESNNYVTDVDPTSGLDENGENYIPFQWQVEIIKREYDDYVLPDGTVYRVPAGAVPPHRHRGPSETYKVPYRVYHTDERHSGVKKGHPKLVETYDRQLLELLLQSWYENNYWDRYLPPSGNLYDEGDYSNDYERFSSSNVAEKEAPKATEKKTETIQAAATKNKNKSDDELPLLYYMTSYRDNKSWK